MVLDHFRPYISGSTCMSGGASDPPPLIHVRTKDREACYRTANRTTRLETQELGRRRDVKAGLERAAQVETRQTGL